MPKMLTIVRHRETLAAHVKQWQASGLRVGLVPTMGALHKGHLSLVDAIKQHCDKVIVSIFVNPTQFAPHEDLESYPRQEKEDQTALKDHPADLIYAPTVEDMYPESIKSTVTAPKSLTETLEGAARPGHFNGVATVVKTLFEQTQANIAVFGEKDYQQLLVIKQLVKDHQIPIDILAAPIIRESDGLAFSSRNRYLNPAERKIAGRLNRVLQETIQTIQKGTPIAKAEETAIKTLLQEGFDAVDYLCVRDAETLGAVDKIESPARLLTVARLGKVRLLDNMAMYPLKQS